MNLVAPSPKSTMPSETLSSDARPSDSSLNFDRLNPLRSARALHPVLQLLRSQYPTGCLSADLIQVVHDQFVVQAKVHVEGVSIVTALASASTVEVAEDRARTRALEALGLPTTPSLNHALNVTLNTGLSTGLSATVSLVPELKSEAVVAQAAMPEAVVPEAVVPDAAPETLEPIEAAAPSLSQPEEVEPKITKTSTKRKTKAAAPIAEVLEVAIDLTSEEPEAVLELAPIVEPVAQPVAQSVVEPVAQPMVEMAIEPLVLEVVEAPVMEIPMEESVEAESFEVTFEGDSGEYEYTFEEEPTLEAAPVFTAPVFTTPAIAPAVTPVDLGLDLADAIAQIGGEIDRIGWTKKQGSGYLQDTYGKRTRAELTESELFAFLAYLKSLPAKVQPDLSALPF